MESPAYVFNCSDPTPTMHLKADLDESDVLCRACGDIIRKPSLSKSVRCKECFERVHSTCHKKLTLSARFCCSDIKKRIVPMNLGKLQTREIEPLSPIIVSGESRCLICGDRGDESQVLSCHENCGFIAHKDCLEALHDIAV